MYGGFIILALTLSPEISQQIDLLGHDRFTTRQDASRQLEDMEAIALFQLRIAAKTHPDAEVRFRSKTIINNYYFVTNSDDYVPSIEGLRTLHPNSWSLVKDMVRNKYPEWYKKASTRRGATSSTYAKNVYSYDILNFYKAKSSQLEYAERRRFATRLLTVDLLEHGLSRKTVKDILDDMSNIKVKQ